VYSPWSERARWALEYAGVEYRRRSYRPLIDEPALRLKLRRWRGPVTVPILETGDGVLDDSFAIARYANREAEGEPLIPVGALEAVAAYNDLANRGMAAGRAASLRRVLESDEALGDLVPGGVRRVLGRLATPIAAAGIRRTLQKYAPVTPADPAAELVEVLEELRAALDGKPVLLDRFSYADITTAQVLAFVEPPSTHLRMTEAMRRAYRDPDLAERYSDLVAWRDALYVELREAASPTASGAA
jgi:glutathione S-transferase